ncbi:hypothetical protein HWD94_17945 [Pseudarthrobacter equi]|uniref:hypothetical protein n=1 Tax=Pseudarthrobacter equi TaxID=728066 RepID=UPI0021C12ACA|nr:hypothetical protein [Pseudarthrobacter equi]MCT9626982.1 hypothetical protein [Pseudarthrobacter equi]
MKRTARFLSSTVLVAGLTLGGSATAAFANSNDKAGDHNSSYSRTYDKDRNDRSDRDRDHRDHRYVYICFDRRGNHWVEKSDRYEHRWNCYVIRVRY